MFTGIIESTGTVQRIERNTKNRSAINISIDLGKHSKGLKIGHSVAINGTCLSVTGVSKNKCRFEMIDETIKKTNLGNLSPGDKVNIERSLKIGDRMEGHFVLGHVDGVGTIQKIERRPKEVKIWIKLPKSLKKFAVKKGSIAIDGISLTLVDVIRDKISVCIIPYTMKVTNFARKKNGDKVNIETDILGRYVLSQG